MEPQYSTKLLSHILTHDATKPTLVFSGRHARAECVAPHSHSCSELILFQQGEARVDFNHRSFEAKPGHVLVIPPHASHNQISTEHVITTYLGFRPHIDLFTEPCMLRVGDGKFIAGCFSVISNSVYHQKRVNGDALSCILQALLMELIELFIHERRHDQMPENVARAVEFIEEQITEPIDVEAIAKYAHVSTSRLHALFAEHLSISPKRYLKEKRMALAKQYLQDPYLSVKEIASRCGYNDVNFFIRQFRQANELPPAAWRKQHLVAEAQH
ncbi:helix-turn-helix domain-containing protein [Poriferisphaera sp. WC338]|uniref:AraC family transcriptional regulator n=1 Tax=Poriferisphaera sp. WC338 TaxID=3425129 RepID=UPI003D81AD8F